MFAMHSNLSEKNKAGAPGFITSIEARMTLRERGWLVTSHDSVMVVTDRKPHTQRRKVYISKDGYVNKRAVEQLGANNGGA